MSRDRRRALMNSRGLHPFDLRASVFGLPYDDIIALDPAVFVQLRYATYGGSQVLFQDAACTVPVETAGQDTIGGVRSIIDGSIIATQATASKRPLWMGEDVGAQLDGVDDHLVFASNPTQPSAATVGLTGSIDTSNTDYQHVWSHRVNRGTDWLQLIVQNGTNNQSWGAEAGGGAKAYGTTPTGAAQTVVGRVTDSAAASIWIDDEAKISASGVSFTVVSDSSETLGSLDSGDLGMKGTMQAFFVDYSALTDAEAEAYRDALQKGAA